MENKIYLKGLMVYKINEHKDGYFLSDGHGFLLESDALLDIGQNLIKFAKKHKADIEEANRIKEYEYEQMFKGYLKEPKPKPKGQIYIMECGGYYKIGVSKNVNRRQKQLDNRPFKVNIIYESPVIKDYFSIEKKIHTQYEDKRINGEWFNLGQNDINTIKAFLEGLEWNTQ